MLTKTKNNLRVELVVGSSWSVFYKRDMHCIETLKPNNSKYVQVSSNIISLLSADAIDNVDDR